MTASAANKADLRRRALAHRDAMSIETRIEASIAIAEFGRTLIDLPDGAIVSGFSPIRSEVDIRPLMADLRDRGARICVPAILSREEIVFRELLRNAPLVDTGFGTVGPGPDAEVLDPNVMLVPLAAFDSRGHRLGYGAGHYDRAIARLHEKGLKPRLIGIAFDSQRVDLVPDEPHDVQLDAILTETGLHAAKPQV
ncbi:5-formyltetrahydrofolate cyclo-ligase [Rhizobium sp. EC-SD404]|uniref:5-formyltetrahydrofolate cyclo-ligase n=1 Tax=Rhizobium sp. EC-SD404 TaxID=2038389 RepID=UPI00125F6DE8|nr:5-formyltetrahydrofolate cyclo-ligase [Rhizobium sp. EC-SD404]